MYSSGLFNEATGEIAYYPVTSLWVNEDEIIVHLTLDGETIETTPDHPFYTDKGAWIPAGDLQLGDQVRRANGSYGTVETVVFVQQPQAMYNVTVLGAHTYFVGAGQWLVHNVCPGFPTPQSVLEGLSKRNRKHALRHLSEFQQYDPRITEESLLELGANLVQKRNLISNSGAERKVFQSTVNVGGHSIVVRVVLNVYSKLRSIHIRY